MALGSVSVSSACAARQRRAGSVSSNSALNCARAQPARMTSASARAPQRRESASIRMDLPAPVSPENTVNPVSNSISNAVTITKSLIDRRRSMSVQIGTTRPARRMFMPAQFVAQGGVMTMAGRMQKGHGITRAAYFHHIFQLKLSQRLGIEIHVHFAPVDDLDRNPRMIWQDDRAVR